ncbi:MAG: hypothetical protein ACTSXN_08405 [Promethearchaeota archaeon]
MEYKEKIEQMREYAKDILVASFINESQVGRSIGSSIRDGRKIVKKKDFNQALLKSIKRLRKLVDEGLIRTLDIRKEIKDLSKNTGVSIGQSQKVINVYLKYYCLLLDKPLKIIKELDCPLDSITMDNKQQMKNINTMVEYELWQEKFKNDYEVRLFRDEKYDLNRLNNTFEKEKKAAPKPTNSIIKKVSINPKKPTKKSVCLEFLQKRNGGSIDEMAQAIVDKGIDPDYEKNKRTCRLWLSKIGFPVKKLENGNYIKA